MYHSAMSNYHIRMRNIAESLQNNVTYAIRSTSLLCTWRLKVKSYSRPTRATTKPDQLQCRRQRDNMSTERTSRVQPLCAYDIVKVAICHSQRVRGQLKIHHRTTNVQESSK